MNTTTLGSRLKALRQARGLLQRDVADAIGVATSSYALYENDRRHPDQAKIKLICQVLHCDPNYLLSKNPASSSGNTVNIMLFKMEDLADGDIVVGKSIGKFALPKASLGSDYLQTTRCWDILCRSAIMRSSLRPPCRKTTECIFSLSMERR